MYFSSLPAPLTRSLKSKSVSAFSYETEFFNVQYVQFSLVTFNFSFDLKTNNANSLPLRWNKLVSLRWQNLTVVA
jgi:hypothetical protein